MSPPQIFVKWVYVLKGEIMYFTWLHDENVASFSALFFFLPLNAKKLQASCYAL